MTGKAHDWAVIGNLSLIGMLAALQATVIIPMVSQLPAIYGVELVEGSWLITVTLLAGALATPIITRLADMFGKRRLVLVTLLAMVLGSLVVALSDDYVPALVGRALQGFSSALIPVAMSIVKDVVPEKRVGTGVALVSATLGIGAAMGLPMAGIVYGSLGWNALFWITAGLGLVLMGATAWLLPVDQGHRGERFDWGGAVLLTIGLAALLLVITQGESVGWANGATLLTLAVSTAALAAWLPFELRRGSPLVDVRLARTSPILFTNLAAIAVAVGMLANLLLASMQLGTPTFVEGGLGLTPDSVGLVMAAPTATIVLMAPLVGRLLRAWGGRMVLFVGAVVMGLSYAARVVLDETVFQVVVGSMLVGVGTSLCFSAMPVIVMSVVPAHQTAAANGVNSLCRMIGTAVSTAGLAALSSAGAVEVAGTRYPTVTTMHTAFVICGVAALSAAALAWLIPRRPAAGTGETAGTRGERPLVIRSLLDYIQRNKSLVRTTTLSEPDKGLDMSSEHPLIDASVHIFFKSPSDLRSHLREPFASRGYPDPDVAWFAPPGERYSAEVVASEAAPTGGGFGVARRQQEGLHPGSDPEAVGRAIIEEKGFDFAILHPMSVGAIQPDWHLGNALLAATNDMMVERWLESGPYAERLRGTIRVNPNDVEGAVREIERWKDHPQVVQIGLPLQTQEPYGRPHFRPLWRAACDAGLPVAVHWEMGLGITHPPTPSGITRSYSHHIGFSPLSYLYHLMNMIAEGVFEQFPDLKVVFADGAGDMLTPFIWRMDTFGRPHLEQTPWAPKIPSAYLPDHVYFVHGLLDGPADAEFAAEWLRMTGKEDMVLFGSSYPDWQFVSPSDLPKHWAAEQRAKVLGGTAAKLYGLEAGVPANA